MPKSDPAHRETDKLLAKMEAEIKSVYTQAYKEAQQTADSFMKQFTEADAKKREALQNGDISKDEYARWQRTQLFQGKRYQQMADTLSKDLTNSNKIAASVINGHLPEVYALNHNYGTYEMESGGRVNTQYTLYDRQTVERLLRDDPDLLPHARVDIPKDLIWNKKSINSAITQGILQGEDIDTISQRLAHTVTDMSRTSAIRNARTMTTSAENGGRIDSYKRAESMGIKMVQVWVATLDSRTRHEHRQLDGQKRKIGEPFTVDGYEIDFPADPKAEPFLVYNCRCTLIGQVQGVNFDLSDTTSRDNKLGDMSYEQWKEGKKKEEPAPKTNTIGEMKWIKSEDDRIKWIVDNVGLSNEQATDIEYTIMEWSASSDAIRAAQQNPGTKPFLEKKGQALENYIDIAPAWDNSTELYRGINLSESTLNSLKVGDRFDVNNRATASWSTDISTAETFADNGSGSSDASGVSCIVVCKEQSGATPIMHLVDGIADDEKEVLVSKKNQYRILSKRQGTIQGKKCYYIEVEQIKGR